MWAQVQSGRDSGRLGTHAARDRRRSGARARVLAAALTACAGLAALPVAHAQERTTLIRVLESASDFRARVRAALALGSTHDASALAPLSAALDGDDSAAVRAACASALGALGDRTALPALRRALTDGSSEVRDAVEAAIRLLSAGGAGGSGSSASAGSSGSGAPTGSGAPAGSRGDRIDWGTTRWLVVVGSMENRSTFTHDRLATVLTHEVRGGLIVLRGVAVIDGAIAHAEADAEAGRRSIPELRVEGSIGAIERERRDGQLRVSCDVSVLVLDEPGRNIRATLTASATAAEEAMSSAALATQERRLAEQACEAAAEHAIAGAARVLATVR